MAGFEPVTRPDQLPDVGTAVETLARDFKKLAPDLNPPEMAKDVAAFANRIGGVLIVGAIEDRARGVLDRYEPKHEIAAAAVLKTYSEAVRDFCSPPPIFEAVRLSKDGGFVVAVNVSPFPGQAVGVRRGRGDDAPYNFPMRTGTDCIHLKPEQLPMLMIPELRRIVALLYAIPSGQEVMVQMVGGPRMKFHLLQVDEVRNVVVLRYPEGAAPGKGPFNIPLDSVTSVWCDESGLWQLYRK